MGTVLDYLLGPKGWCVIRTQGNFIALERERLAMPRHGALSFAWKNLIVKDNIREKHAMRLARTLRQRQEDTPEQLKW